MIQRLNLREERGRRGLSLTALAKATGIKRSTLHRLERPGRSARNRVRPDVVAALADWLELPFAEVDARLHAPESDDVLEPAA